MAEQKQVNDYLTLCQSWQRAISRQSTKTAKNIALNEAFNALQGQTFRGTRNIIVQGDGVLHIPDGTSGLEESIWPWMQFREVKTRGWLGKLYAIVQPEDATLTWPIYDPHVLRPAQDEEMPNNPGTTEGEQLLYPLEMGKDLRRPLHFPVGLIDFAACYAR